MRTFTEEDAVYLYSNASESSPIFIPHKTTDKHGNEMSKISFPDYTYSMVHHVRVDKTAARQNATIWGGKDKFVKFSSYWSDNDSHAHTVSIQTKVGEFYTSWGDGDNLGVNFPDAFTIDDPRMNLFVDTYIRSNNGKECTTGKYWGEYEDNEVLFIMHVFEVINNHKTLDLWFNKAEWEIKKSELEAQRFSKTRKA